MHELSLSSAVVATAEKHADGSRVTAVNLRVGRLRQVVPESLGFYFEVVARGTVCEGARLGLEIVPAELRCAACGHRWELVEPQFSCPRCAATDVAVTGGDEFEVESIEIAIEEEDACIART